MEKVIHLVDTDDLILLLDYPEGEGRDANLIRVYPDGAVVWRAEPPDIDGGADAWVAARVDRHRRVSANSWSCYYCEIDPKTGAVLSATFTK